MGACSQFHLIFYRPRERKSLSCRLYTLSRGQKLGPVGENQQRAPILALWSVISRYVPPASSLWERCVYPFRKKQLGSWSKQWLIVFLCPQVCWRFVFCQVFCCSFRAHQIWRVVVSKGSILGSSLEQHLKKKPTEVACRIYQTEEAAHQGVCLFSKYVFLKVSESGFRPALINLSPLLGL